MSAKHTEGPWRVEPESFEDDRYFESSVWTQPDECGNSKMVAVIRVGLQGSAANAHLVAAAPTLLEECRHEITLFEQAIETLVTVNGWRNMARMRISELRAAIAKATEPQ